MSRSLPDVPLCNLLCIRTKSNRKGSNVQIDIFIVIFVVFFLLQQSFAPSLIDKIWGTRRNIFVHIEHCDSNTYILSMYAWISVIIANFHHKYNRHHIQIISKELNNFWKIENSERKQDEWFIFYRPVGCSWGKWAIQLFKTKNWKWARWWCV